MHALLSLMRQFTIRMRMYGAIAMVLGLFTVVGTTGLIGGLQLKAVSEDFVEHSLAEMRAVTSVRTSLGAVRLHEKNMVIDYENPQAVSSHRQAWTQALAATRQTLHSLTEGEEDEDNAHALAAADALQAYEESAQRVLDNLESGSYDTAKVADRQLQRAKERMTDAEAEINAIAEIVEREVGATGQAMGQQLQQLGYSFSGVLAVTMLLVVPLTLLNMVSICGPLEQARALAQRIAQGDLTAQVDTSGRDEAAALQSALLGMQLALQQLVGQVRASAESISVASAEVATGNTDLSARTEQTASSLQQTASSMEQITGSVRQSAEAARQARQLADSAADVAQRGGSMVTQVVQTMGEIDRSSQKIADIIGTIDGIAFQTNILALNAAVEAARAGEQGRGFAVVAAEVRSLAQRSATAAKEIKTLIGDSVERVGAGSKQVQEAGGTMEQIVASVQRVTQMIGEITTTASEQSDGIGQVNGAVTQLDRMTQQNAALVEESAAAAESLKAQARKLTEVISVFRTPASSPHVSHAA